MAKPDIRTNTYLEWNEYKDKAIDQALPSIYGRACAVSGVFTDWYWKSIQIKRRTSLGIRSAMALLVVIGTLFPILAGLWVSSDHKLLLTQFAICALALAGLLQVVDKVFGWSSGWLRYIATVTAMENLSRKFEFDWAGYILHKNGAITDIDVKPLFDIAVQFQESLMKLQNDETDKWVAEFNTGTTLLGDLIKSQQESSEKADKAAVAALSAQKAIVENNLKAGVPGAVELSIFHKSDPIPLTISFDNQSTESFLGTVWSCLNVAPGIHNVTIESNSTPPLIIKKIVEVPAGGVARLEVKLS